MSDLQGKLRRADLSSSQLTDMGGFDPRFVIYLLSLRDDLLAIADHVEPPGDSTPGLLRDDLSGVGDITTAPTSNQAYILDQKTITNTQLISQLNQVVINHVGETNPHNTSLLDLIDIANTNYIGLARSVPVVTNDEQGIIVRRLFAADLLFDDTNIGSGAADQQALNEHLDNQIALREAAPSTVILTGGVMTRVTDATIDVSPGSMQVIDAYTDRSAPPSVLASLSFAGVTGLTIDMPDRIGIQTVYLDLAGNIMQQPGRLTNAQTRTLTRIGFVDYKDSVIGKPHPAKFLINEAGNLLRDFLEYSPPESRIAGLNVNPVDNLLSIFGDSGTIFIIGVNHEINALDPNVETFLQIGDSSTAAPFDVKFGGNLADFLTSQLVIPKFYESSPGVAAALSGNDATIMYVYRTFNDEFIIQLGVNVYTNGAAARDALGTDLNGHVGFDGSSSTFLLAQIYADRTSVDFIDQNKAGVVSITGAGGGAGGDSVLWGDIDGLLSDQTDLQAALDGKEPANINIQAHIVSTSNPHSVSKADVGLGNADNTSDINKPVSTATQSVLNLKENSLGNPVQGLQFLTSSVGGSRSWSSLPAPSWGTITGNLSSQTDLNTALNNRFSKGVDIQLDKADPKIVAKLASLTNGTASFELRSNLNTRFMSIDALGTDRSVKITKWDSSGVAETVLEFLTDGTLTINGDTVLNFVSVPASSSSPGKIGDIAADANFIYKTIAEDTWVRSAATTW